LQGGKSTLLRAVCAATIFAHIGAPAPAAFLTLSPVDAIFTRLGASDRILSGESTFMVECSETAAILRAATRQSLVILDELGRGTSTFDGYAIAAAVLGRLVRRVGCRLLFATHYHPLTVEFRNCQDVQMGHMAATCVP
jgi:DNA mismatch repair protein MSH6